MRTFLILMLASLLIRSQVSGNTPTLINYQGRLTNVSGSPVPDGSYSVAFTIYDAAAGGTSKWTETQSVSTSGGLFAVLLGSLSPLVDSVFIGTTRYLGVKVGTDPEMLPRVALVSVPFSMRTATVDGTSGGAISGNISLDYSTPTTGNVYKGGAPFIQNIGTGNTCVGTFAGNLAMTGGDNSAFGMHALTSNTSGFWNTASGENALYSNTTGGYNTANGLNALYANTTGIKNTASGVGALFSNATASGNTAIGTDALHSNTIGDSNTASGVGALFSNTSGYNNVASGLGALYSNTAGGYNTAGGTNALHSNTTGGLNTASGVNTLYSNTTGGSNTASGYYALYSNTTGGLNVASGFNTLTSNTTASGNTAIGSNSLQANMTGDWNAALGLSALYNNVTGSFNTACGAQALGSTTGSYNTAIGYQADVSPGNVSNSTAIGYRATVSTSNKIRLGNTAVTVIEGQVAYTFTSDRNQKENFLPVDGKDVLLKIRDLSLTSWNYKNSDPKRFRHYGPVAQEFYAAFGHDSIGQCGDSISINSGDETGILMIAVQALEKDREQLAAKVEATQAENAELKTRLTRVEAVLNKLATGETGKGLILGLK